MTAIEVSVAESDKERREFARIARRSLGFTHLDPDDWLALYDPADIRVARVGSQVAGGLILLTMGQFFGGRSVPMVGIHAVAVAPEHRGAGVASALMAQVVGEIAQSGAPLSALFPATQPVYRRAGYEHAGTFTRYRVPTAALPAGYRELAVEPIGPADRALIAPLYREHARAEGGLLDRIDWSWGRLLEPLGREVLGYRVVRDGETEGYLVYSQRPLEGGHGYVLDVHDFVSRSEAGARRLLSLLADHRSLAPEVRIPLSPAPWELALLREQEASVAWSLAWMIRVADVAAALSARGYPAGLERRVSFRVQDSLCPQNARAITVEVAGGRGQVTEGAGPQPIDIDIRGLASLFSGYLSGDRVARLGLARGRPAELAAATELFAGPAPWLPEIF